MAYLNRIASNWSFQEREKLNNNWGIIENYLSNLQGQINVLTGDVNVQELIDQLNSIFNQSNIILEDLEKAINDVTTVISNAQSATSYANNAAQEAIDAIANIQSIIEDFGSKGVYENGVTYSKNNIVYDDGCSYIYINTTPSSGNPPPIYPVISNDHWHRLADKGASGSGAVSKVNGKEPDGTGEVTLTPADISAASSENLTGLQKTVTEHLAEITNIPRARYKTSSPKTLPNTTWTNVSWDVMGIDTDKFVSQPNNESIIINKSGEYLITTNVVITGATAKGYRNIYITKNGNYLAYQNNSTSDVGTLTIRTICTGVEYLEVGDIIEIRAYQDSGVELSIGAESSFSITKIAGFS
ncbi:hypothetical protein ACIQ2D_08600 [Lysinibacillus sp. NPDC097287]|uniref:hypothetical protein n=1 Tax=Lysinibacillus sp. NPDC097287 TaxID=3364144 RepID=UPI0037FDCB66